MQKERKNSQARQNNNDLVIKQSQGLKKKSSSSKAIVNILSQVLSKTTSKTARTETPTRWKKLTACY